MSELRVDRLTGQAVYVATSRQSRPNLPSSGCPFCPGGLEAPDDYDVRWLRNRWPSMPNDRCEVVLYSPRHDAAFWELGVDGATKVVDLWSERTLALGSRDDIAYVLPFENRGPEVGATISHPHGQIYAFDSVPPTPLAELEGGDGRECALCAERAGDRVLFDRGGVRAWATFAPSWPYELVVAPVAHVADLPSAGDDARAAIAAALIDVLERLDRLFAAPMPYMLWVHQRPTTTEPWPLAHVHLHIAPYFRSPGVPRFVAAGELGSGLHYNPVSPEDAAVALRDAKR